MPHLVRGLRARKTMGSPHAPENPTPTPAVNLRVDIDGLAQGLEGKGGLSVVKDEQQPEQFSVDASGRGDDRSRFHSPRLCRIAVFLIQTNVSLAGRKA